MQKEYAKRTKGTPTLLMDMRWPLTGGVPSELSFDKDIGVERIYVAGYQDGSVRIWDATHPVFNLLLVIVGKVRYSLQTMFRFFSRLVKGFTT